MNRLSVLLIFFSMIMSCSPATSEKSRYIELRGSTMGTSYECKVRSALDESALSKGVDSLLNLVNMVASTYIPNSSISIYNRRSAGICMHESQASAEHMKKLLELSERIVRQSDGYFDPTLMPLVNFWGFGYKSEDRLSENEAGSIDSLLKMTGFGLVTWTTADDSFCIEKKNPYTELDMSAIAKGYAVDLIAAFFKQTGSTDYYVNIGGEVVVKGRNSRGTSWNLGINYPDTTAGLNEMYATIALSTGAMATSGNYRNFYTSEGHAYVHTINPKTGLASPSDLVSMTVVADNCAIADAVATACMAMGFESARSMIDSMNNVEGFFIYKSRVNEGLQHMTTEGLKDKIKLN